MPIFKKFRKDSMIIFKLKEVLSLDFIFYLMINYYRYCHKLEILRLCNHI